MSAPTPPPGMIRVCEEGGGTTEIAIRHIIRKGATRRTDGIQSFINLTPLRADGVNNVYVTETPAELDALIADAKRREWEAQEEARQAVARRYATELSGPTRFIRYGTAYDQDGILIATDSVDDALGGEQV